MYMAQCIDFVTNHAKIGTIKSQFNGMEGLRNEYHSTTKVSVHPLLLFDTSHHESIENLVNSLPAKSVTDRLINIYTRASDFPTLPIHLPTFFQDYNAFWNNPRAVTLPWLSILFSLITLALQFVIDSGKEIEGIPFLKSASQQYASNAAECLRRSDYAKSTPKMVEAMVCKH